MKLLGRLRRLWRAQWRGGISDDVGAGLEQLLDQLDEQLAELRAQLAGYALEERRLADQVTAENQCAQRMLKRARQALAGGRESLAREAISRHLQAKRQGERYRRFWTQHHNEMGHLRDLLDALEAKRAEVAQQLRLLTIRGQMAHTRQDLARAVYGERGRMEVERAEEAMLTAEFTADAYQELTDDGMFQPPEQPGDAVEKTLAALRRELGLAHDPEKLE